MVSTTAEQQGDSQCNPAAWSVIHSRMQGCIADVIDGIYVCTPLISKDCGQHS
jgi:hypothetical protein